MTMCQVQQGLTTGTELISTEKRRHLCEPEHGIQFLGKKLNWQYLEQELARFIVLLL